MNRHPSSDPTVSYYDNNARLFRSGTEWVDMSHLYAEYLPLIPKRGKILDAGCGSGRDALFFKRQGYVVTAFDASSELAALATQSLGEPVRVMTFLDVDARDEYDGVWACASLIHIAAREMDVTLRRLVYTLKSEAHLYASFKYGSSERQKGGRFFNDYDEAKLQALLVNHPELTIVKLWQTTDARPDRHNELWLNVIVRKVGGVNP